MEVAADLGTAEGRDGHQVIGGMGTSLQCPCPIAGEQGPVCAGCSQEVDIQDGHQLRDAARSGRISCRSEVPLCPSISGDAPYSVLVPPYLPFDVDRPEQPAIA